MFYMIFNSYLLAKNCTFVIKYITIEQNKISNKVR